MQLSPLKTMWDSTVHTTYFPARCDRWLRAPWPGESCRCQGI